MHYDEKSLWMRQDQKIKREQQTRRSKKKFRKIELKEKVIWQEPSSSHPNIYLNLYIEPLECICVSKIREFIPFKLSIFLRANSSFTCATQHC